MSPSRRGALAFAGWMLGCAAVAIWLREPLWCGAGGLVGLAVRTAAARGAWTPSGKLGLANGITAARLIVVAALPLCFDALPRLGFVALIVALLALDGFDGWLARTRGEVSAFGAALDMETDALSILVLALLLWQKDLAGAWVLAAGLWRYVYASLVAVVPSLGEAPRTRFGRWVFLILTLSFAGAFLPVALAPTICAAAGTALVSISFVRSLAQSRAFAQPDGSAANSSAAASAQDRRDKRAA